MTDQSDATLQPDGRVVMVSGANRGIGLEIAKRLHSEGYVVSAGVRKPEALVPDLEALGDGRLKIFQFDAEQRQSAAGWVGHTLEAFGRLDGLVNNAGVLNATSLDEVDEAALDQMWEVNVKAPYRLIVAALPELRKAGRGRIVNVVSLAGLRYPAGTSPGYTISKFAALALTHATRHVGWDDGVRVTALCPGLTRTDMTADAQVPGVEFTSPATLAAIVAMVLSLPNNASVATLPVNCLLESTI